MTNRGRLGVSITTVERLWTVRTIRAEPVHKVNRVVDPLEKNVVI